MTAPRFSILLPTHNRADVLGYAIASVLAQSEPDFELLVVADGCTDNTAEVVAGFTDPRIRFFDLPKAPHFGYANRNLALREARGRLVAFAAHDDLLLPDHLALMGELIEHSGKEWGYSRPLWVSTDGIIVPFCTNLGLADEARMFLEVENTIPAACIVHTRAALDRVGFWPEDVPSAADWVLWRRMIGCGAGGVAYLRQPTNLHFSANWRQSRFAGSAEMRTLLDIADGAAWWPAILRNPPAAEREQATIWRAMRQGGAAWTAALRAASETVIDRIAWTAVRDTLPRTADTPAQLARAEQALADALAEVARVEQALATQAGVEQALAERAQAEVARAERARAEQAKAEQARAEAVALVEAMHASTCWRITAPLRGLRTLLRPQRVLWASE